MSSIATLVQLAISKLVEEQILAMHSMDKYPNLDRAVNITIVFIGRMRFILDIT